MALDQGRGTDRADVGEGDEHGEGAEQGGEPAIGAPSDAAGCRRRVHERSNVTSDRPAQAVEREPGENRC